MASEAHLDYQTVCRYFGQSWLEQRHQFDVMRDSANSQIQELAGKLDTQSKYVRDLELQLGQTQAHNAKLKAKLSEAGISLS